MSVKKRIYYKGGLKYQLAEIYTHNLEIFPEEEIATAFLHLSTKGRLIIRAGYAWDGPSGPTYDSKNSMRGSLVHDAIYQLIRMQLLSSIHRNYADKELRRICREDGMSWLRASSWYYSVKYAAGPAANPKNRKKAQVAP